MASNNSNSSASDAKTAENRNFLFEIDLNEIPSSPSSENVSSPIQEAYEVVRNCLGNPKQASGPPAELPGEFRNESCVCGRVEARGGVVVCDGCEKWFHLSCAGMRSRQAIVLEDWACGACVEKGVGSKRWPLGFVGGSGSKGNGVRLLDINALPPSDGEGDASDDLQYQRMYASDDNPSSSLAYSDLWKARNGFDLQSGSSMITHPVKSGVEGIMDHRLTMSRSFEEADLNSHLGGTLKGNNANTKLRKKELARISRANSSAEKQEVYRSSRGREFSDVTMEPVTCTIGSNPRITEGGAESNDGSGSQQFKELLPVQYEDFYVIRLGKIDVRPTYHIRTEIWPVGYQSRWHDKITGSLFTCDVLDGGDSGPVFTVRRCPCPLSPISNGSTILMRPAPGRLEGSSNLVITSDIEDDTIKLYLSDPDPRGQDLLSCLRSDLNEAYNECGLPSGILSEEPYEVSSRNTALRDEIGELCVEGKSYSLVWAEVSEKLVSACRDVFTKSGSFHFYCKHELGIIDSGSGDANSEVTLGSLTKLCCLSGPVNIPHVIHSVNELDTSCKALSEWLKQDRFGLDVEFVQELIEQLPGAQSCSGYELLDTRREYPTLQTARSGHLMTKRKRDVQCKEDLASDNFLTGCKKQRMQGFLQTHDIDVRYPPPGKPLSTKLSAELVSEILQVWEFLWRFYETLGMKEPLPFQELEKELVNPWSDGSNFLEIIEKDIQENKNFTSTGNGDTVDVTMQQRSEDAAVSSENLPTFTTIETGRGKEASQARLASRTYYKCTGVSLTKIHSSLLKILVGELQAKVAPLVDPNFDNGESKSRRGRKKDIDNSIPMKMSKIDMVPVNELTWPELARRYILAVLSMDCNLDSSDITSREGGKVFRCLQGDGGVLCGSLTGVAGMEADALLLAGATKQIFGSLKGENDLWVVLEDEDTEAIGAGDTPGGDGTSIPEWAKVLEPVRKLPTNVGTRIRKCVYEALDRDPPEWARKILEHSISKEVYKGNASGPTKKAVLSVLAKAATEGPQKKPDKERKEKGVSTISDIVTKQCRIVLRRAVAADESKTFCNLLGTTSLDLNDYDDVGILGSPAMVSRPLDFRTIDLRLAVGYYGGSPEAFLEQVREVWYNIRTAYGDKPELVQLAEALSQNFESLYEKEVVALVQKLREHVNPKTSNSTSKKELIELLNCANDIPKAPWDSVCKVCGIDKEDENVLLCDGHGCNSEYHKYCLIPPLTKIPVGNWYCPSCVAGEDKGQIASKRTKFVNRRRQKRYQGENSRAFSEALNRLAITMGEKEYWEFSVEERIFLLKFLCDEVLNSTIIRAHLDQCADMSSDLQQKLRSLSVELRNLKFREETLATRSSKDNLISFDGALDDGRDKMATLLTNYGRCMGQRTLNNSYNHYVASNGSLLPVHDVPEENKQPYLVCSLENYCNGGGTEYVKVAGVGNGMRDESSVIDDGQILGNLFPRAISIRRHESNGGIEQPFSTREIKFDDANRELNIQCFLNKKNGFDAGINGPALPHNVQGPCLSIETRQIESGTQNYSTVMPTNLDKLLSCPQNLCSESENPNLEANSLKDEISVLMDSVASIESQLLKVTMRREYLGRDSGDRLYWILGRPEKRPWLVVDGSTPSYLKRTGNDFLVEKSSSRCSILFHGEASSYTRGSAACSTYENQFQASPSNGVRIFPSIFFYDSDFEIQALIGWLRDSDPRERDLRDSILQFHKLWSQAPPKVGNNIHYDSQVIRESLSNNDETVPPRSLFTKAAAILENSYGPCFEPDTTEIPRKRGRKMKVVHEDRLYRCECLEPIWPSRHHCLSCHHTFCTSLEVVEHNDGKCHSGPLAADDSKENDESSKGKAMMRSEATRGCAEEVKTAEALKSEKFDVSSKLVKFQKGEMVCPYNIEEISRKFVSKDSNKELVKEIGLLGSNGIPSFVHCTSPYIHDPTLVLDPAQKGQTEVGSSTTLEMDSSHAAIESYPSDKHITNQFPKRSAAGCGKEASKTEVGDYVVGKVPIFSTPELDAGDSGIVPMSALRPLVGKDTQVLRRLKINLLDIDAVLPEEAFRPSKAHSSTRRAWRAFVKSAESILEMVKASMVLGDMIKTEYLRNGWWYWSSLSAAARTSTMSSLALRIYALDASIIYEKTPPASDGGHPADNLKSGKKRKGNDI
ncbi:Methyl-cpg-binding domain-containing protein [Thalictrum thalictroides]|uniref:Methyl-cpg-binding domain-containing protein n=1 Tax=Thalictrum thalictroides TaxID=46969 RepID=A0A7J6UYT2_THATH|nr:Methyl-cpg-binding domain-containing protein [Thalictrum thalictroides]